MVDQPLWGARVHALGVGPKPIPQKKLTADKLANAIQEVMTNQALQHGAETSGERIRAEDGIANAIEIVERIAQA